MITATATDERPGPGMRAIAVRKPTAPSGRISRLSGVLLPPAEEDGPPRLHVDGSTRIVTLAPPWEVAHERPLDARRRDRRVQFCPAGRPVYRHKELPAAQLATKTMLRRRRRKPADGQEPIASYLAYNDYSPLYAVADSVPLRALSPAGQAAWTQARTCTRCGAACERPWPRGLGGERYCTDCQEPAAAAWWYRQRIAGRTAAVAWAAEVLAAAARGSGELALVQIGYPTSVMSQSIVAEAWDGEVLLAARVCDDDRYFREGKDTRPADLAKAFRRLAGRRLISWRGDQHWLDLLQGTMLPHCGDLDLTFVGGEAGVRWDEWCAERRHGLIEPYPFRHEHRLGHQTPPAWDPPTLFGHVRAVVTRMATQPCYWWRATCQSEACDWSVVCGTSAAADAHAGRHHRDTGHTVSHTTEPGTELPAGIG